MNLLSWQPSMTADTTTLDYWLNWKVLICSIWILAFMIIALIIIWRQECSTNSTPDEEETQRKTAKILSKDQAWRPCLKQIHPAWLLAFRVIIFFLLLALLIADVVVYGVGIFYYYTQWTFTLVTIYFGLGSVLSIYGCYQYGNRVDGDHVELDAERGTYVALTYDEDINASNRAKGLQLHGRSYMCPAAGTWGCILQVIFQMNVGAVVLTDCAYWLIIFPFLSANDYNFNALKIGMHSVNVVVLLGDTALNCLQFPWFRVAYFILWTATYVIYQWIIHACVSTGWPYPFFDLSSPYAPVWYLLVGLMHFPCYGVFVLIVRMKDYLFSRWFPHSYQVCDVNGYPEATCHR